MSNQRSLNSVFTTLFPQGPAAPNLVAELAPEGWEKCELFQICHPTPEQILRSPALRQFPAWGESVQPERECAEVLGLCLRDVFGVYEVMGVDEAGETFWVEEGTWRGTSHDIADWTNGYLSNPPCHYMDFYVGSAYVEKLVDLTPVYGMIFRRFQEHGLEMLYTYPSWFDAQKTEDREGYLQLKAELDRPGVTLRQLLGEQQAPPILSAYHSVFGRPPKMADY